MGKSETTALVVTKVKWGEIFRLHEWM